jgi:hypothetical protein
MKIFTEKRAWFLTAVFTMLMAIALPATTFGDNHGRRNRVRHLDKKCGKFVNCHDARDGRRVSRRVRRGRPVVGNNGQLVRRDRDRDREFNDNNSLRNGRIRERDRDADSDSRRHGKGKRHEDHHHNK